MTLLPLITVAFKTYFEGTVTDKVVNTSLVYPRFIDNGLGFRSINHEQKYSRSYSISIELFLSSYGSMSIS